MVLGGSEMSQSIRDKWCEKEISDLDYIRHLEAENVKLKENKTCGWKDDGAFFDTQCGKHIYGGDNGFEDVDMRDTSFKFCPYCGREINKSKEQQ